MGLASALEAGTAVCVWGGLCPGSIAGRGIALDYHDIEWFTLETNRDHSVVFEIAPKWGRQHHSQRASGRKNGAGRFFSLLQMGANNSSLTPLNCILKNWDRFDPQGLKKTHLVFLCDTAPILASQSMGVDCGFCCGT